MLKHMIAAVLVVLAMAGVASAQTLTWSMDPNAVVTGFNVERALKSGTTCGTFAKIATTGNVLTYKDVDATLKPGAVYCYQVNAFNPDATSGYSNVATYVKPLTPPTLNVIVAVNSTGPGSGGTVLLPNGTVCSNGSTCTVAEPSGATVTMTAKPKNNSRFTGWSGAGCGTALTCTFVALADTTMVTATFSR